MTSQIALNILFLLFVVKFANDDRTTATGKPRYILKHILSDRLGINHNYRVYLQRF